MAATEIKILSVRVISGAEYFYQEFGEVVYQDRACKQEVGRIKYGPIRMGSTASGWWYRPSGSNHWVAAHGMNKRQAVEHLAELWDAKHGGGWRSNPARLGRSLKADGRVSID